jgi:hypothetical protein
LNFTARNSLLGNSKKIAKFLILQYLPLYLPLWQGAKNWILPKEINANRFLWDSHWLEIWLKHLFPSMLSNGGIMAIASVLNIQAGDAVPLIPQDNKFEETKNYLRLVMLSL